MPLVHPPLRLPDTRISQYFGASPKNYAAFNLAGHEGVDFAMPIGTPVPAAHDGVVRSVGEGPIKGKQLVLQSTNAQCVSTGYSHLDAFVAREGARVTRGETIARSGNTGRSTGPHLHLDLFVEGMKNAAFKDHIDPLLFRELPIRLGSKLSFHNQKPWYHPWLKEHVIRSNVDMVKLLEPHRGAASPFGNDILYNARFYRDDEPDKELIWEGEAGARKWVEMFALDIDACASWIHFVEGPNEPTIWTRDQANRLADFEQRRIDLIWERWRLLGSSLCFSTGHPDIALYTAFREVLAKTALLNIHCYGMRTMDPKIRENADHLYRWRDIFSFLRREGIRIPPTIISETGIDLSGDPDSCGYRAWGFSDEQYLDQLLGNDDLLQEEPAIYCATPFTWNHEGWPSFAIEQHLSMILSSQVGIRNSSLTDTIGKFVQAGVVPLNENAALAREGSVQGFVPASDERTILIAGMIYVAQVFRDPEDLEWQHIAYCEHGDWGNIHWFCRRN